MTLVAYQAQIGDLIVGARTDYVIDGPITGLGVPSPRTSDLDLPTGGTLGGRDLPARRPIAIPVALIGDTPEAVMAAVDTLNEAFAPTSTDITLDICLPGVGTRRYTGRPRGIDLDLADLQAGAARARLLFDALNPDWAEV